MRSNPLRLALCLLTLLLAVRAAAFAQPAMSDVELQVIAELNLARTNPQQYATFLEEVRSRFQGDVMTMPGNVRMSTREGVAAVDEAIRFLRAQQPLRALGPSTGLALAARDQVRDQGRSGATGHDGSDGSKPAERVNRYGQWQSTMGENIAYGMSTPRDIVIQLIVDDGVPTRGHRTNIFKRGFGAVGVSIGRHPRYRSMCVMDFAGGFIDRQ